MSKIMKVVEQLPTRTFKGADGERKAVDVLLKRGKDEMIATAFGATAQKLVDNPLTQGEYYAVSLEFAYNAKTRDNEPTTYFQRITITSIEKF